MRKKASLFIAMLIFCLIFVEFRASAAFPLNSTVTGTNSNKEWKVKLSQDLDSSTVNSNNVTVLDSAKRQVAVNLSVGNDNKTIYISPKTGGYNPGEKYTLILGTGIKSLSGTALKNAVTFNFTIGQAYSDGTSYSGLPQITSDEFQYLPLLSSQKQAFLLNSTEEDVQYRIFAAKDNTYNEGTFQELTDGYTTPVDGKVTANTMLTSGTSGQMYKIMIYVKRNGATGVHKDLNTDYDNYVVDYLRCVSALDVQDSKYYINAGMSLSSAVAMELKQSPVFVETNVFTNAASSNIIKYYMNPNNFLDEYGKYEFLKLSYSPGITAANLNAFLQDKGVFKGYGQTFIDAAKANDISVSYLVSHAMLETGNGKSKLASGSASYNGKTVYNFFGIGAVDSDPIGQGSKKAYEQGWFTVPAAISGGAKWIAGSYINNPTYKQNTIYKMRWNLKNPSHQYATDTAWAYKQIGNIIKGVQVMSDSKEVLDFEIPKYN